MCALLDTPLAQILCVFAMFYSAAVMWRVSRAVGKIAETRGNGEEILAETFSRNNI